ncbi:hypothetical protein GCM10009737_14170 [Nocardioides lentus]|uniref:TadE-like domain-containing protein n=1 Tax=Nocardioides lentus TaxID=338077 RepID=A0ABN2P726_9ACTN
MTAETAMALPVLVAVTIGLVWLLSVGLAQVRVVDAARETARAAARGDDAGGALEIGRRVAPPGASVDLGVGGDEVRAVVTAPVVGPGGVFGFLPTVQVRAEAVTVPEARP